MLTLAWVNYLRKQKLGIEIYELIAHILQAHINYTISLRIVYQL
jgi:hypothetical protein